MRDFRIVPATEPIDDMGRIQRALQYKVVIHGRQSDKRQKKKNKESYELQTKRLHEKALKLGWEEPNIIPVVENRRNDGAFISVSGTLRIDQRKGMMIITDHIKRGEVKTVMTYAVDRLFRDIDMIEPAVFVKLCKAHQCIVITNTYTYDFNAPNRGDADRFRKEADEAKNYILNHVKGRMLPGLKQKSMRGEYDGRVVAVGYTVNYVVEQALDEFGEEIEVKIGRYVAYEPHARVVRWIFKRYRELAGSFSQLCKEVGAMPYVFPFYPEGEEPSRNLFIRKEQGYGLSRNGLQAILVNPVYIGAWYLKGEPLLKDNHPAIVEDGDFWYAFNSLSPYTIDGEKREVERRVRFTHVGTIAVDALLEGVIKSDKYPVYVTQGAMSPEKAFYNIIDSKRYFNNPPLGSIQVKHLDSIFTKHLLSRLERYDLFTSGEVDFFGAMTDECALLYTALNDVARTQEQSAASLDDQIEEYKIEADGLDRVLRLGSASLDDKTVIDYTQRLGKLRRTQADLENKKAEAAASKIALAEFASKLPSVASNWHSMSIEKKRRFIALAVKSVTLTAPTPSWLYMRIDWAWLEPSGCFIWHYKGTGVVWTPEEDAILRELFPQAERATILQALPARSWGGVIKEAGKLHLSRSRNIPSGGIHVSLSVNDQEFMREHGIRFDPDKYVYWLPVENDDSTSRPFSIAQVSQVPC